VFRSRREAAGYLAGLIDVERGVEAMLRAGMTHREMAKKLGYKGHGTVQYHLERLGILSPNRRYQCRCRACVVGRSGFEEMLARGMSRRDIALALGYKTQSAITYHFRRLGVDADLHSRVVRG
jgi:hypothetical protein